MSVNIIDKIKIHLKKKAIPVSTQVKTSSVSSFTESTRSLLNPGCGWYQIYSFNLAEESPLYIACEEEQLVLLRIDIHAYRATNQIPDEARDRLDKILSFFAKHDKGIILRIVYDTDGHGIEHEPASISIVKSHMTQIGSIICRHRGEILVHQGIFVGSWGEMHSSKFLSTAHMTELVQTLYEAIGGICPIAVRKPVQFRSIASRLELKKKTDKDVRETIQLTSQIDMRIAQNQSVSFTLFNDGIFGSETDLGTYGIKPRTENTKQTNYYYNDNINNNNNNRAWARQDELDWQETQMQRSFTGGEAVGMFNTINAISPRSKTSSLNSNRMIRELAQMHVSYLNSTYRQEQLDAWKNQNMTWNGETISVYDYIGRHLGYRFTVIDVKQIKNKEEKKAPKDLQAQSSTDNISHYTMQITIRNTGFANLCEEAECKLLLVSPQIVESSTQMPEQTSKQMSIQMPQQKIQQEITLNCDPRTWDSGSDTVIECDIPVENNQMENLIKQNQKAKYLSQLPTKDTCNLYLQLTRKRDGRLIAFANKNADAQYGLPLFRPSISFGVSK